MKKLIAFISSLFLLMNLCSFCIFAEDSFPELTKEKATEILTEAYDIRENLGYCFYWYRDGTSWLTGLNQSESKRFPPTEAAPRSYGYIAFPVKDGYSPEEVKERIRTVFSRDYAEQIIRENKVFFDFYFRSEEDSTWYYWYELGAQVRLQELARPTELDWDSVRVVSCADGRAVAAVNGRSVLLSDIYNYDSSTLDSDFRTTFELVWENGQWKVAGGDYAAMLYSVPADRDTNQEEFSEETAVTAIIGALYDVYFYTTEGYPMLVTEGVGASPYWNKAIRYSEIDASVSRELEGNIADPETWRNYARRFCTEEVVEKLVDFNAWPMRNGRLSYYKGVTPVKTWESREKFGAIPEKCTPDRITILSQTEDRATVQYRHTAKRQQGESSALAEEDFSVTLEFVREPDGWKISGGDFMETMDAFYDVTRVDNPSMGDNLLLPGLAAAALLVLPLVRRKRKIAG